MPQLTNTKRGFSTRAHRVAKWLLPTLGLAFYATAAYPAIYKCKDNNGSVVYSEAKCEDSASDITPERIKILPITGGGQSSGSRGFSGRSPSPGSSPGGSLPLPPAL